MRPRDTTSHVSARAGIASILAASALFATTGTARAIADPSTNALAVGGARLIVAGIALVVMLPAFGQRRSGLVRLWRRPAVMVAGVATAAFQVSFFAGVQAAGVALGTLLVIGSVPVFAGLLSWVIGKRRPSAGWLVSTAICLGGLGLLFSQGLVLGAPIGVLLCLLTGFGIASYAVAARVVLDGGTHPVTFMASAFALGAVMLAPLVAVQPLGWLLQPSGIALALYLGLATMVLANWLQLRGLAVIGPAPAMTLNLAEPLLATFLGVVLLGESLDALGVAGLVLVIAGLALQSALIARRPSSASAISSRSTQSSRACGP